MDLAKQGDVPMGLTSGQPRYPPAPPARVCSLTAGGRPALKKITMTIEQSFGQRIAAVWRELIEHIDTLSALGIGDDSRHWRNDAEGART